MDGEPNETVLLTTFDSMPCNYVHVVDAKSSGSLDRPLIGWPASQAMSGRMT